MSGYIHLNSTTNNYSSNSWTVLTDIERRIKEKIEKVGTPLKDWDIQINYGIKTGFNEAFIIDGSKRKELIEKHSKSEEIIRPILRGRDIKRYNYDFADLWLINTHNGTTNIPQVNIDDFPAIKEHLNQYYEQLVKRQDKGNTPYNLRSCAYIEDFSKEKIIFQEMVQEPSFVFDNTKSLFCLDTGRIITGKNLKYLLSILNSKLFFFAIISNMLLIMKFCFCISIFPPK